MSIGHLVDDHVHAADEARGDRGALHNEQPASEVLTARPDVDNERNPVAIPYREDSNSDVGAPSLNRRRLPSGRATPRVQVFTVRSLMKSTIAIDSRLILM